MNLSEHDVAKFIANSPEGSEKLINDSDSDWDDITEATASDFFKMEAPRPPKENEEQLFGSGVSVGKQLQLNAKALQDKRISKEVNHIIQDTEKLPTITEPMEFKSVVPTVSSLRNHENYFVAQPSRIRVADPLVSHHVWGQRTEGRTYIPMNSLQRYQAQYLLNQDRCQLSKNDWYTVAVLVNQPSVYKKDKSGNSFSVWIMSDLENVADTLRIMLFRTVHEHWHTTSCGKVFAILKPKFMPAQANPQGNNISGSSATLTLDNASQLLLLGKSADFGLCGSLTKSGTNCHNVINKNKSPYCDYHVKNAYNRAVAKRPSCAAVLNNPFRNKNNPKYPAIPNIPLNYSLAKQNSLRHLVPRALPQTNALLIRPKTSSRQNLVSEGRPIAKYESNIKQQLNGDAVSNTMQPIASNNVRAVLQSIKNVERESIQRSSVKKAFSPTTAVPVSSRPSAGASTSYRKAVALVENAGGMSTFLTDDRQKRKMLVKRRADQNVDTIRQSSNMATGLSDNEQQNLDLTLDSFHKRFNMDRSEMQRLLQSKSRHANLAVYEEQLEKERFLDHMEKVDEMELQLMASHEIKAKIFFCKECKFRDFKIHQSCRDSQHSILKEDGLKRFYKCGDCGERTVTLRRYPTKTCGKCGSMKFKKTGRLRESSLSTVPKESLVLRGEERKYVNK